MVISLTTRVRDVFTKEAFLYAGADWLILSVSQRVVRGQLVNRLEKWVRERLA